MSTHFTSVRGEAMGVDVQTSAPTVDLVDGQIYLDTGTNTLYIYDATAGVWRSTVGTSTSTSTSISTSTSTSTSSTSTSSSSTSTSTTSTSSSSTSTSTTLI